MTQSGRTFRGGLEARCGCRLPQGLCCGRALVSKCAGSGAPIMDEPRPTSAPASANRDRLAGIIQSVILMAGSAVLALPIILSGKITFLTSLPAVIFFVLFTSVFVPLVWAEIFESHEWARRRLGEKRARVDLIPFYTGLGRILRPVLDQFSWWRPFRLGRFSEAVLLPDSVAIFVVCLVSLLVASPIMATLCISMLVGQQPGSFFWSYLLPLLVPAVLASPFVLTAVLWISREEVRLVRFFVVIPYWFHRMPHDAELELDDGPLAFTSRSRIRLDDRLFAFITRSYGRYELQLGTSTSALRLYRHISDALEGTGWKARHRGVRPEY